MFALEAERRRVPQTAHWQDGWLPVTSQHTPVGSPSGRSSVTPRQVGGAAIVAFMEADSSPDGFMQFAREYGYLGVAELLNEPLRSGSSLASWAEHIDSWRDAQLLLTWANRGWESLDSPERVKSYVGVRAQGKLAGREVAADPSLRDVATTGVILAVDVPLTRTLIDGKSRYRRSKWYPGITVPAAIATPTDLTEQVLSRFLRDSIVDLTNRMLAEHCAPQLVDEGGRKVPEVRIAPTNLLGQMWLETTLRFTGQRRYTQCKGCKRWVDITESRSSREYCHPPRDAACRKRHQRSK